MKSRHMGLVLVSAAGLCQWAVAQQLIVNQPASGPVAAPQARPDPSTLPNFVLEQQEHHFGDIFDNDKVVTRLTFRNDGPGTLQIMEWRGSCSCTVGELHVEGEDPDRPAGALTPEGLQPTVVIPPGGRGWLDVSYDPHNRSGLQTQTVTFTINDPTRPIHSFRITANVIPLVQVEPPMVVFNQVPKNQGAEMVLYVTGRSKDFRVTQASISGPDFVGVRVMETVDLVRNEQGQFVPADELERARPIGPQPDATSGAGVDASLDATASARKAAEQAPPGVQPASEGGMVPIVQGRMEETTLRRTRLVVVVSPDAPPGRFQGTVSISTSDERRPVVSATFQGEVVGDVAVLPRQVAIGLVPAETMYERRIQVLARNGANFRIERVEEVSNLPDTHRHMIQVAPLPAGSATPGYIITVRGKAPRSLAQINGEFIIHTTLPAEAIISVPFFGHVQGQR